MKRKKTLGSQFLRYLRCKVPSSTERIIMKNIRIYGFYFPICVQTFCGTEPFPSDFKAKKYKVDNRFITKVFYRTPKSNVCILVDYHLQSAYCQLFPSFLSERENPKMPEIKLNMQFHVSRKFNLYHQKNCNQVMEFIGPHHFTNYFLSLDCFQKCWSHIEVMWVQKSHHSMKSFLMRRNKFSINVKLHIQFNILSLSLF